METKTNITIYQYYDLLYDFYGDEFDAREQGPLIAFSAISPDHERLFMSFMQWIAGPSSEDLRAMPERPKRPLKDVIGDLARPVSKREPTPRERLVRELYNLTIGADETTRRCLAEECAGPERMRQELEASFVDMIDSDDLNSLFESIATEIAEEAQFGAEEEEEYRQYVQSIRNQR